MKKIDSYMSDIAWFTSSFPKYLESQGINREFVAKEVVRMDLDLAARVKELEVILQDADKYGLVPKDVAAQLGQAKADRIQFILQVNLYKKQQEAGLLPGYIY